MQKCTILFIYSLFLITSSFAEEKAETFILEIFDSKYKVVSPNKFHDQMSVIIENKSLNKVAGKMVTSQQVVIDYVSIMPGAHQSVEVGKFKGQRIFFVPLTPPVQEIELIPGKQSYEIPPKRNR